MTAPGSIRVEDTGPGLAPEELGQAFERFYLHSRYGRERPVGTGARPRDREGARRGHGRLGRGRERPGELTVFTVRLPHAVAARPPSHA